MADEETMLDDMEGSGEVQPQSNDTDEYVPPSIDPNVWHSAYFRRSCELEMVTLSELAELDKLEKQIVRLRKLLSEKRLNETEYAERARQLLECDPEEVDTNLAGLKFARDLLLKAVMNTMQELERQAEVNLPFPIPSSMSAEEFLSKDFGDACDTHGVSLATVAETERIAQEADRLERLHNNERINNDEYHRNILSLTGVPPSDLPVFYKQRRKAEATLIAKIRKKVKDIRKLAAKEEEAKQNAARKKEQFLSKAKAQIDEVIAKEQAKADLTLMRKRSQLEKLLIQRGIEDQLRLVEDADAHLNAEAKEKPGTTSGKTYEFVSKGTAAVERKKLFLDHKMKKSRLNKVSSQDSEVGGVPARVLAARANREKLNQERLAMIEAHHQDKLASAAKRQGQQMEKREKIFADAKRKKEKRDQTVLRMEWANTKRKEMLQSKIKEDEDRLSALKDLKTKQQTVVSEIQTQAVQKERALLILLHRATHEPNFDINAAIKEAGVDLNLKQVEDHVLAYTSRLCAQTTSITTPSVPHAPPDSVAKRHSGLPGRSRPVSAPPGGPSSPDHSHNTTAESYRKSMGLSRASRPSTATPWGSRVGAARRIRPLSGRLESLRGRETVVAEHDDKVGKLLAGTHSMERLERLRVVQAQNLYHIVVEEQEYERERQRMRAAIQAGQRVQLDRLFQRERQVQARLERSVRDATDRIMRAAGENELVMLQEMALIAAEEEEEEEGVDEDEDEDEDDYGEPTEEGSSDTASATGAAAASGRRLGHGATAETRDFARGGARAQRPSTAHRRPGDPPRARVNFDSQPHTASGNSLAESPTGSQSSQLELESRAGPPSPTPPLPGPSASLSLSHSALDASQSLSDRDRDDSLSATGSHGAARPGPLDFKLDDTKTVSQRGGDWADRDALSQVEDDDRSEQGLGNYSGESLLDVSISAASDRFPAAPPGAS